MAAHCGADTAGKKQPRMKRRTRMRLLTGVRLILGGALAAYLAARGRETMANHRRDPRL